MQQETDARSWEVKIETLEEMDAKWEEIDRILAGKAKNSDTKNYWDE